MVKSVRDVMSRSVVTCTPEMTARAAAQRMVGLSLSDVVRDMAGEA